MGCDPIITELTALQNDGLACVVCCADFRRIRIAAGGLSRCQRDELDDIERDDSTGPMIRVQWGLGERRDIGMHRAEEHLLASSSDVLGAVHTAVQREGVGRDFLAGTRSN